MDIIPSEHSEINLTWENLSVHIDKTLNKCALDNVSGYARAGRVLALMGPSSSGKTTLMTLLGGRPLSGQMKFDSDKGHIYLGKQKIDDKQILIEQCGYVEQPNELGALIDSITVREHLVFQVKIYNYDFFLLYLYIYSFRQCYDCQQQQLVKIVIIE
jgi:ABC-type multidrug transport system ATPase subunit